MTYEEAEQIAIDAGALEPLGMVDRMAANHSKSRDWSFSWADTPRARARLAAWTQAVLNGVPPQDLKRQIG